MTKRIFLSILALCTFSVAVAAPASAADKNGRGEPTLLSSEKIDWIAGSSEWVHLTWTASHDIENVQVRVIKQSDELTIDYPDGAAYTSLMVDENLSANEIDFTAIKVTTEANSKNKKQKAKIEISWDQDGKRHTSEGSIEFSNKTYEGEDFAILTDEVYVTTDVTAPEKNWVEFAYKGLAPTTSDMQITASGPLEVYHPQDTYTSLHHDQTLHGGEVDVARVWFDPELLPVGAQTMLVTISYTDATGVSKSIEHKVNVVVELVGGLAK